MMLPTNAITPVYFGKPDEALYGCYHAPPSDRTRDTGVVLCYPWLDEYYASHRTFRQLATQSASRGFPTLRFDYYGCGDSAGESRDGTLSRWKLDVSMAVEKLKEISRVDRVCLVGLRIGANLALLASRETSDINALVLWDRITDVQEILPGWAMTSQQDAIELQGQAIGATMIRELGELDFEGTRPRPDIRILALTNGSDQRSLFSDDEGSEFPRDSVTVKEPRIWLGEGNILVPSRTLGTLVEWMSNNL